MADELRIGPLDILLAAVEGVPVYEMQSTPKVCYRTGNYIFELRPGYPVGFSFDVGAACDLRPTRF
jgi:uncharacterized protein (DUF779 family)